MSQVETISGMGQPGPDGAAKVRGLDEPDVRPVATSVRPPPGKWVGWLVVAAALIGIASALYAFLLMADSIGVG